MSADIHEDTNGVKRANIYSVFTSQSECVTQDKRHGQKMAMKPR